MVVRNPDTLEPVALKAGEPVPDWATDLVHADNLGTAAASSDTSPEAPAEPPRAGRGSGLDAWTSYAESLGIDVPDDAQRDDVIDLVDQHNEQ